MQKLLMPGCIKMGEGTQISADEFMKRLVKLYPGLKVCIADKKLWSMFTLSGYIRS